MLVDQTTIFVRPGKGGDGCVSFRREKFIPKGGPDGGDGGDGGDVVLVGDESVATLLTLARNPHQRAEHGEPGRGKSMHGANGKDREIPVPLGTLAYDQETSELLADIQRDGQRVVIARGGQGGLGNEHFKSPTNQTPREHTLGESVEERAIRLELKLIADVGLVGKPNAGKSTLLRSVSRAKPKVADYPFTTLSPNLGIAALPDERRLVIADIPGLIEGAAEGAGLGHDFLKHIERTTMLVHVLDLVPPDDSDPVENYQAIRRELFDYASALAEKPELVALNKVDLLPADDREIIVRRIVGRLSLPRDEAVFIISGATGEGVRELLEACWRLIQGEAREETGWRTIAPSRSSAPPDDGHSE